MRHRFKLVILILSISSILASCSQDKTVSPPGNVQTAAPQEQAAPAASAASGVGQPEPAKESALSPQQVLFLRVNPHSVSLNPYSRKVDLTTATKDIWVMSSDGSNAVNLTSGHVNAESADWSPDKSQIVFDAVDSYLEGLPVCHLSLMNADGSGITKISPGATSRNFPAWSPDGHKIASSRYFVASCNRAFPCKYFTLFISNPDGSGDAQLSMSPSNGYDLLPRWLPDSQRLAFLRNETGYYQIYLGDTVKGNVQQYKIDGNLLYMPWFCVSQDANTIAYSHDLSRDFNHTGREIFAFDIRSGVSNLLTNNGYADDNPVFSPDGSRIMFASFGDTAETSGMFTMNIDGTDVQRIASSQYGDMPMQWK